MTDQVGRIVRVQVGELDVSALDVEFSIKRSLASGHAGTCDLKIHNLSPAHRAEIVDAPRLTTYVAVDAGYETSGVSRLFTGDKRKAIPSYDAPTWTLDLTAGDGEHAIRTARVNRSFAAGSSLSDVVEHIARAMGVGIGNAVEVTRAASFATGGGLFTDGTTARGLASAELSRLCAAAHLQWSVQNGNLELLPIGGALQRTAILLSPDSGMVGSPKIVNARRRVIEVTALIQPGLTPGQMIVVRSKVIEGTFRITEVTYKGSLHGAEFYATMTAHAPRPPLLGPNVVGTGVE